MPSHCHRLKNKGLAAPHQPKNDAIKLSDTQTSQPELSAPFLNLNAVQQIHQFVLHEISKPEPILTLLTGQHLREHLRPLQLHILGRRKQKPLSLVEQINHGQRRFDIPAQAK
ncbi:hypothetical protein EMIT0P294_30072 [Pseudomonas sp. IT-P294]